MEPTENKTKLQKVLEVSNPKVVKKNLTKYTGDPNYKLFLSSQENKKYMVITPEGKLVHFGDIRYEDFTKHNDKDRRARFRLRNVKWAGFPLFTAGNLAYNLLW